MKIQNNISLSEHTTFAIGGNAKYFVEARTREELIEAIKFAREKRLKLFVLGGGSNVLISDNDFDGLVVTLVNNEIKIKGEYLVSGAGVIWDDLVKFSVSNNLKGIECLSGIPGSVGGAIVGNIGAFGEEIKDTFVSASVFDVETLEFEEFENAKCEFEYRDSYFKKKENKERFIIFEAKFLLSEGGKTNVNYESLKNYLDEIGIGKPSLLDIRNAVLTLRERNYTKPKEAGNAGSFFKNVVVTKEKLNDLLQKFPDIKYFEYKDKYKVATGWLIEKAGWKGRQIKNVAISPKHALVIMNPKMKAKAIEVVKISEEIQKDVENMFGIKIEREVEFVNF